MDRTPTKTNPQLLDRVFGQMQTILADNLPWLDHAFGKAERLKHDINGKIFYFPNVYVGKNEYEDITPDDRKIGNYSFFTVEEPQFVDFAVGQQNTIKAYCSLIVWVDMRTVEQSDERNTELVKRDILRVLNGKMFLKLGSFVVKRIFEKAENIFDGYTLDEIHNQYLMHPFCGWRFWGELTINDPCL